jgi:hypothetical protein
MRNDSRTYKRGQGMTEYLLICMVLVLPLIMPQACGSLWFIEGETSMFNQLQEGLDQREKTQKQILFDPISHETLMMQGE